MYALQRIKYGYRFFRQFAGGHRAYIKQQVGTFGVSRLQECADFRHRLIVLVGKAVASCAVHCLAGLQRQLAANLHIAGYVSRLVFTRHVTLEALYVFPVLRRLMVVVGYQTGGLQ